MDYPSFDDFLNSLTYLESLQKLRHKAATKDQIQTLKVELRLLKTFVKCIAKNENLKRLSAPTITGIKDAGWILLSHCLKGLDELAVDMVPNLLKKIQASRQDIRSYYEQVSVSSQSYSMVMGFVHDLVEVLRELLICKFNLADTLKRQIEVLQEKLRFLRNFLDFAAKRCGEHERLQHLLAHCEAVVIDAACLSYSCLADETNEKNALELELKFSNLLWRMKPMNEQTREIYIGVLEAFKSSESSNMPIKDVDVLRAFVEFLQDNLSEILNCNSRSEVALQDQMKMFHEELSFLRNFLTDLSGQYIQPEILDDLLRSTEALTVDSGSIIFCGYLNEVREVAVQMDLMLLDFQERMKHIKTEAREIYRKPSKFPTTSGLGFVQSLLEKLKEILSYKADSIPFLKHQIGTLLEDFEPLCSPLGNKEEELDEHEKLNNLPTRLIDVSYRAEYVIDSFFVKECPVWYYMPWLSEIIEEVKLIKADVNGSKRERPHDTGVQNPEKSSSNPLSSQANVSEISGPVVGFEDVEEELSDLLTSGSGSRDIISIVGMPGLGKTTLAKKVFNNLAVKSHFRVRAWCRVSQVYDKKDLLLSLLSYVTEINDQIKKMLDHELAQVLYKSLKERKYFVVMDDVWSNKAWLDLRDSFPDDNNGSRIMFTSQLQDVSVPESKPYDLRPFRPDESWQLLQKLVFSKDSCSSELAKIGEGIAKSCEGLPLSVFLIAGLLAKDKTENSWKQIAKNLTSGIAGDRKKQSMAIIELSYKHLPDHLKPCFLYFGAFQENEEVPASKLIRLWNAEGLVRRTEGNEDKSSDDIAEDYLEDIVSRSLVTISKIKSRGEIKACRVHSLLSHFCKTKSEEENFWQFVDALDYGDSSDYSTHSMPTYELYRLSIHSSRKEFVTSRPSGPQVRSLLLFPTSDSQPLHSYNIAFILDKFKLLRVLDLGSLNIGKFPTGLESMVHLKYLAVRVNANFIPPSMANLWNLETFLVKGYRGEISIPATIWKMRKLRHLHVNDRAVFGSPRGKSIDFWRTKDHSSQQGPAAFSCHDQSQSTLQDCQLDNLETLSTPCLSRSGSTEKILRKFPNARKLRCIFLESWDDHSKCNQFPKLELLNKLESLKVHYHGNVLHPSKFSFPSKLKKLTLSKFRLPWSEISQVGELENLEVLKIQFQAFQGKQWDLGDLVFPTLRYLKLDNLDVEEWVAVKDNFPRLQQLLVHGCKKLESVPSDFGMIDTLEMIEVKWCTKLDMNSVREIELGQKEDLSKEKFKVTIYPQDWDVKSS